MLVLTRKAGETIVIEGGIVIQVLPSSGQRMRLGISAPNHVAVHRGELLAPSATQGDQALRSAMTPSRRK